MSLVILVMDTIYVLYNIVALSYAWSLIIANYQSMSDTIACVCLNNVVVIEFYCVGWLNKSASLFFNSLRNT